MKEHAAVELEGFSTDEWDSPPEITGPLLDFYDVVGMDPATNERSIIPSLARLTEKGLVLPWYQKQQGKNRKVYLNEPYSISGAFTDKANYEMASGNVEELVRLTMGVPSTAWWRRAMLKSPRNPRVIFTCRLSFLGPIVRGKHIVMSTCRFEPALIYYGPRVAQFERAFKHISRWTRWGRD